MEDLLGGFPQQLHLRRTKDCSPDRHHLAGAGCQPASAVRRDAFSRRRKLANRRRKDSLVGGGDAADEFRYHARKQPEFLPQCDALSPAGRTDGGANLLGRILSRAANLSVELRAEDSDSLGLGAGCDPGPDDFIYVWTPQRPGHAPASCLASLSS